MQISTSRFGDIEIDKKQIINFPHGIPGFMDKKAFIPIDYKEDSPFKFLQSIDDGDLAFVITDPFALFEDYQLELSPQDKEILEVESPQDVNVYVITTIAQGGASITVNLQAPLVFNIKKNLGKQVILYNSPYPTRYPLELKKASVGAK